MTHDRRFGEDVTPYPVVARAKSIKKRRAQSQIDKDACDRLFSLIVRAVGHCERCGSTSGQLQCAHIMSRRYTATRCFRANAWCLCSADHRFLTENPHEHVAFAVQTRTEAGYRELQRMAYEGRGSGKVDWTELRKSLKARAIELGVI